MSQGLASDYSDLAAELAETKARLREAEQADDETYPAAAGAALQACITALWGVDDDHCLLMLGAASLRKFQAGTASEAGP